MVATFGDEGWSHLARSRAVPSAEALGVQVVHVHGESLHGARNAGVDRVRSEWVCHLDGDDELTVTPSFFEAMATATADVRVPSVTYIRNGRLQPARLMRVSGHDHDCNAECLLDGNWVPIGAMVRTDLLRSVGGWRDFTWSEDWDMWLRCHLAGATFEAVPDAVYRAHVRRNSRNRSPSRADKWRIHHDILHANGLTKAAS